MTYKINTPYRITFQFGSHTEEAIGFKSPNGRHFGVGLKIGGCTSVDIDDCLTIEELEVRTKDQNLQLRVVDETATDFGGSVGMSLKRQDELSKMLDEMHTKLMGQRVRACNLFNEIGSFCHNLEEYTYCVVNHCNFLAVNFGIFLCPPQKRL